MNSVFRVLMILLPIMDSIFTTVILKLNYPFIIDRETLKDHKALRILQRHIYRELRLNIYVAFIRLSAIIDFVIVSMYYQNLIFIFFIVNVLLLYLMLYSIEKAITFYKMIKCFNYTFFKYNKNR